MLRSTHRPQQPSGALPPLPEGWTAHTAPTGHPYYYNAATKQSTYTHPATLPLASGFPVTQTYPAAYGAVTSQHFPPYGGAIQGFNAPTFPGQFGHGFQYQDHSRRGSGITRGSRGRGRGQGHGQSARWREKKAEDRPKSKHLIPGHAPWVLVKTRFGRQFVHNSDSGLSTWKIPEELKDAITRLDEQKKLQQQGEKPLNEDSTRAENLPGDGAQEATEKGANTKPGLSLTSAENVAADGEEAHQGSDSDEYEEVEVTDDDDGDDDTQPKKRPRLDEQDPNQPREFNEDDIAFQLAAMGQEYGLDPGEYEDGGEGDWEAGAEGLPLTEEESTGLFKDLLDDHGINPFSTWKAIVKDGTIIEDDRYIVLPNMKSRKEVWGEWSREKIQALKEQREKAEKKNPLIPYLSFLQAKASPKLYWPEFRRKYKNTPEMRDVKISDKQREKLYREHISRMTPEPPFFRNPTSTDTSSSGLKIPESTLKSDFSALLKAQPLSILNRSTNPSLLPPTILTDIRYISLDARTRDALIEAYISTLGPAPAAADPAALSMEEQEETQRRRQERERREKALAEREERIAGEKRRHARELQLGRERLRAEETQIARAMRVGKDGLKAQLLGAVVNGPTPDGAGGASGRNANADVDGQSAA
ncbi:MAG: hypothetical protein M1816_007500 [Peltula sp. TS41687]|nr:MAG: hypothetical protein M1816_007500 [Peltula sp. TS41687]